MFHLLLLSAAVALGDTDPSPVAHPADLPEGEAPATQPRPIRPEATPGIGRAPFSAPDPGPDPVLPAQNPEPDARPAPDQSVATPTLKIVPELPAAEPEAAPAAPAATDRWFLMRELQGTAAGYALDSSRISISGWLTGSYNTSQASFSNQPVVWTDRTNEPLFQQGWVRFERSVATSGTTQPSWGFRADFLSGSDYRFSLPRGLWNSQLLDSDQPSANPARQNLYGIDPIQHYVALYVPTLFQGTEFRIGRHYCPWGAESLEAVSTPLMSRSYAFNWSPPFTHYGFMMLSQLSPQWNVNLMAVNGNDVMIGDPAEEWRFVGKLTWTSASKRDTVAIATSLGRGKFNTGQPFNPPTISLMFEPAGRNNMNAFDLYWIHVINSRLTYQLETIYAYQYGVPTFNAFGGVATAGAMIDNGRLSGTAHWGSICQYLFYTFSSKLTGIARFELFDDFEGQRTGYEGLYTAVTCGLQIKPYKWMMIRPEIRYDINNYSKPFDPDQTNTGTRNNLLSAGADLTLRW